MTAEHNVWTKHAREARKKVELMHDFPQATRNLSNEELIDYLQSLRAISKASAETHTRAYAEAEKRGILPK